MNKSHRHNSGFTLVEVLVAIILVSAAAAVVALSFSKISENQALNSSAETAAALTRESRSRALAGANDSRHGVYLGDEEIVMFQGAFYVENNPQNISKDLHPQTAIRSIVLQGGGRAIVFEKLRGNTAESGSFEIYLKNDPQKFRSVTVSAAGLIEVR